MLRIRESFLLRNVLYKRLIFENSRRVTWFIGVLPAGIISQKSFLLLNVLYRLMKQLILENSRPVALVISTLSAGRFFFFKIDLSNKMYYTKIMIKLIFENSHRALQSSQDDRALESR